MRSLNQSYTGPSVRSSWSFHVATNVIHVHHRICEDKNANEVSFISQKPLLPNHDNRCEVEKVSFFSDSCFFGGEEGDAA